MGHESLLAGVGSHVLFSGERRRSVAVKKTVRSPAFFLLIADLREVVPMRPRMSLRGQTLGALLRDPLRAQNRLSKAERAEAVPLTPA